MPPHAPSDNWLQGNPYEQYIGRWSRRVAPPFLAWLCLPAGLRWLDVGCGTGALAAAIRELGAPAAVTGVEPSAGFLQLAAQRLGDGVALHAGSADRLPLPDAAFDAAVSGLVLNFVPDLPGALAEMARVTADGGTVAAYVWDYAGRMELIRHFWDAAAELDATAVALHEGARFPVCDPAQLVRHFTAAALQETRVTSIEVPTVFADFDDYWTPFLGGQGPAPTYAMALPDNDRDRLRERLRARLPRAADGSIALVARAWAVRGTVVRG